MEGVHGWAGRNNTEGSDAAPSLKGVIEAARQAERSQGRQKSHISSHGRPEAYRDVVALDENTQSSDAVAGPPWALTRCFYTPGLSFQVGPGGSLLVRSVVPSSSEYVSSRP